MGKIAAIASAADYMTQLVEDLLLLARTEDRQTALTQITFPIDELLEELVDDWQPLAEAQQIVLKADLAAQATVCGNPVQLKRLFVNLMGNAAKYTPAHRIVTLQSQTTEDWVIVRIQDTECDDF